MTAIERLRANATGVASIVVTGIWLGALLTNQEWWLGALIIGYVVVIPLVAMVFGDEEELEEHWGEEVAERTLDAERDERTPAESGNRDALDTLRERYARGDLTDEQFERKLEHLLETESIEDVEDRLRDTERETLTE